MRVTQRMLLDRSLASTQSGRRELGAIERQIATGLKLNQVSDDPVAGRRVLELDSDLRRLDQFDRNIASARSRLDLEDATLQSVTDVLARARELGVAEASAPSNADTRRAAALEIRGLRATLIQQANQTLTGSYVYGGAFSDRPPLDLDGNLDPGTPARGAPSYEIAAGQTLQAAHDAGQLFVDSDVMGSLRALEEALLGNDQAAIETGTARVRAALTGAQDLVAEVGARQVRLDVSQDANESLRTTLRARRSELAEVSLEEAVLRLATVQSAFQATLLATNRILDTTLVNYLR